MNQKKETLELWMDQYGTDLLRMNYLYLQDVQLAEDVTQETFIRAYLNRHGFREESSVKTWLTRISINLCKDQYKQAWSRRTVLTALPSEEGSLQEEGASRLDQKLHQETVIKAVLNLPLKYREVIILSYYREMTADEIGSLLALSRHTVSTRIRRAKKRLKTELESWWTDER